LAKEALLSDLERHTAHEPLGQLLGTWITKNFAICSPWPASASRLVISPPTYNWSIRADVPKTLGGAKNTC